MALLEADVEFSRSRSSSLPSVREKALGQEVMKSITPGQQIVKVFHDELADLLGGDAARVSI